MFLAIEIWVKSLEAHLAARGVSTVLVPPESGRQNAAISLNLSTETGESDLVLWESGEGELVLVGPEDAEPRQEHLEGLTDPDYLAETLSRMLAGVAPT